MATVQNPAVMAVAIATAADAISAAVRGATAAGRDHITAADVAGHITGAYCAMDDVSAKDAADSAGDELRAMSTAGLARALAGALAEGLPADKVQRLNYYLQVSMGSDAMRTLSELAPHWRTEN